MARMMHELVTPRQAHLNGIMTMEPSERTVEPPFADLLAAVAERHDRSAFAELFEYFAPRIKGYMRRLGVDHVRADDLAQEVMLTVWRRAALYDQNQAAVATWIFTIARNKRIDGLRRERRPEIDPEDPALVGEPDPAADQLVSRNQINARLRTAVNDLPEEQAEVLRKNFFEDKPHTEIAEELDLPLGTVKSRARLALTKLRQTIKDLE